MTNLEARPDEIECGPGGAVGSSDGAAGAPGGGAGGAGSAGAATGRVPVEIITSRDVPLGGPRAMTVKRTLPQRQRSMIGA